jgi:hypothetical protein
MQMNAHRDFQTGRRRTAALFGAMNEPATAACPLPSYFPLAGGFCGNPEQGTMV